MNSKNSFKPGVNTEPEGIEVVEQDIVLINVDGEMIDITEDVEDKEAD